MKYYITIISLNEIYLVDVYKKKKHNDKTAEVIKVVKAKEASWSVGTNLNWKYVNKLPNLPYYKIVKWSRLTELLYERKP